MTILRRLQIYQRYRRQLATSRPPVGPGTGLCTQVPAVHRYSRGVATRLRPLPPDPRSNVLASLLRGRGGSRPSGPRIRRRILPVSSRAGALGAPRIAHPGCQVIRDRRSHPVRCPSGTSHVHIAAVPRLSTAWTEPLRFCILYIAILNDGPPARCRPVRDASSRPPRWSENRAISAEGCDL